MVKEGASIIVVILFAVIFIAVIVDFIRESKSKKK
jgi:cbb3-type cytochrome oxidase subunit 3